MCFPRTARFRRQRQNSSSSATKIVLCALGLRPGMFSNFYQMLCYCLVLRKLLATHEAFQKWGHILWGTITSRKDHPVRSRGHLTYTVPTCMKTVFVIGENASGFNVMICCYTVESHIKLMGTHDDHPHSFVYNIIYNI